MDTLIQLQHAHPAVVAVAGYVLFMAFVSGMPEPKPTASVAYQWLYTSLHILSVNLNFLWQRRGLPVLPGQTLQADTRTSADGTTQSTVKIAATDPATQGK